MKDINLKQIKGKNLGYFEISAANYDDKTNSIMLKTREFDLCETSNCRTYKKFNGNNMEVVILDKYGFNYTINGILRSSMDEMVKFSKGVDFAKLPLMLRKSAWILGTTYVQSGWIHILDDIGQLDKEDFQAQFEREYANALVRYYKKKDSDAFVQMVDYLQKVSSKLSQPAVSPTQFYLPDEENVNISL